jgi:hypothetical protein
MPARLPGYDVPAESFWSHCIAVAALSERLAKELGFKAPALTFTAGLLHDAAIRRDTHGRSSLVDVARRLLTTVAGRPTRRVTEEEVHEETVRLGGRPAAGEWARVVAGTSLISAAQIAAALRTVTGVELPPPASDKPRPKILSNTPTP